ncbi:MAG: UDP-N-acetylglucosamine diphosphorylase/glucosamine-1-phosphate N-acetyltransferase [Cyclobacteriaceae bacterium]|jgi:UDP-N-acetylglucosamine diphosphorylase/glucosamine-1-phosphate N-acetyltransferase
MHIILFDLPEDRIKLFPLTLTRPISHIRVGILTILEKWKYYFPNIEITVSTADYLHTKFKKAEIKDELLWINAGVLPDKLLFESLEKLKNGHSLNQAGKLIAFRGGNLDGYITSEKANYSEIISVISRSWDIFQLNGAQITSDYQLITKGRKSEIISDQHTKTYGSDIFLEKGATIKAAVLNAENGPIYLGKNAEIQEGALIRGPFSLGEGSVVNMGAKMRGDTTVGPFCKVGGEISNTVIFGYSNKGHGGFIGNAVIGEWCNFGADTNNSNLKNNYTEIKMWDFEKEGFLDTGLQFCGLVMGDHSKTGINTMFNSGTTVGVSANIFGPGFPRTYIPSFSWGGAGGFESYNIEKALDTARLVVERRKLSLTEEDKAILTHIFENYSF